MVILKTKCIPTDLSSDWPLKVLRNDNQRFNGIEYTITDGIFMIILITNGNERLMNNDD